MKCPNCGSQMVRHAESWTKADGSRNVVWRCPSCAAIVNVKE